MEFIQIMMLPFLACLVLAGIHSYLGFHVIERQVIFVDLALAQIAVLGASFALIIGKDFDGAIAYWLSLSFTIVGAAIFSLTRFKKERIPQEAIIGITYVVSAALVILVLSRSGEGDEHIKQSLVGNILLVSFPEVVKIAVIYMVVGIIHYIFREKFFMVSSKNAQKAFGNGINVKFWDFLFYVTLGIVVTSSVKIAGVLLVFSFLVVPAVCAMLFTDKLKVRLILGWLVGFIVSVLGIIVSYFCDLPTGACVVATFGVVLIVLTLFSGGKYAC
ncbi:MAG: metal ABC transporter permease [Candidatus Omnitrophica bacterium]|nr:metal ABC transporter permease [Candidatus Omnitrophota bacterium]